MGQSVILRFREQLRREKYQTKMKTSSFISIILIVGLVYLFSYVHSSPTDSTPILAPFQDLISRSDKSTLEYLADKAIGYVTSQYPSAISRMSRQLAPRGLDMEESMKALLVKVLEWVAYVVAELVYL